MNKITRNTFFICITLFLIGCNSNSSKPNTNLKTKSSVLENSHFDKDTIRLESSLNKLQGIWVGEKDLNQSIPYRIQYENKVLDIICVEGICDEGNYDNSVIEISYLGFSDNKKKSLSREDLKNNGNLMVKLNSKVLIDENYIINDAFYTTSLTSSYMYDEELYNVSSFSKINSLPIDIFCKLKSKKVANIKNIIREFNIYEFSSKIKVVADKTFFHSEMSETSRRKAFLVRGDIAYLESMNDKWAKVYYDGKIVSGGYVKIEGIEVIK
ncbi:hypothetical protein ACJRPK_04895 [Aquimarina sp. 2-A2]|uniref:hypothetical protein n=1 Tax=Aquimarina sp. 2-A2 TaxID=3382644 RepID=UPI00387EEBC4